MSPAAATERVRRILHAEISRAARLGEIHDGLRGRHEDAEDDRATARALAQLLALVDAGALAEMDAEETLAAATVPGADAALLTRIAGLPHHDFLEGPTS